MVERFHIGGLSAVRQFVRIGENAMIAGMTGVANDIIPFGLAFGTRAYLEGLNIIGMKRRQLSREAIGEIRDLYSLLFQTEGVIAEKIDKLAAADFSSTTSILLNFLKEKSLQGYCLPKKGSVLSLEEDF